MKKKGQLEERAALVQRVLQVFYPNPPVPLNHFDSFSLLVAVVLSAQTTDGKVNDVTKRLFQVAPTPSALSAMSPKEVEAIIKTVGLAPRKAEHLVSMSTKLLKEFDGKVPQTYAELESLPGVGHKTASVMMSQAFGEPAIAVDTHVHRLALRWGLSKDQKNVNKVQQDLCALFPPHQWNDLHLQMIYFGREYCTAKSHENALCPICSWIHKTPLVAPSTDELRSRFSPQKKMKGIVHYTDRMLEIASNPSLVSPSRVDLKANISSASVVSISSLGNDVLNESTEVTNDKLAGKVKGRRKRLHVESKASDVTSKGQDVKSKKRIRGAKLPNTASRSFHYMTRAALAVLK